MTRRLVLALVATGALATTRLPAQDTTRAGGLLEPLTVRAPADSALLPLLPLSRTTLGPRDLRGARAGTGLEDALARVPGVSAQGRGTAALDARIVMRGAGARSAFGTRGVSVVLDGVPQTLPDGQTGLGQVDVLELDRVRIVRGAAAAFYGGSAGGVLDLASRPLIGIPPESRLRLLAGSDNLRGIHAGLRGPVGRGGAAVAFTNTAQDGWRAWSAGALRQGSAAVAWPLTAATRLRARFRVADLVGAENPGALTAAEFAADPRQASARNVAFHAGKDATEWQASADIARVTGRSDASAVVYLVRRDLDNPLPSTWVRLARTDVGARLSWRHALGADPRAPALLAGVDLQRQADLRRNFANDSGRVGAVARLDQRETVAALGARAGLTAPLGPRTTGLVAVRVDRVAYRVRDRLTSDGDASGTRRMSALSVSAGARHRLGALELHANLGSAFETPTTTELARPGVGGFNAAVGPQRSWQGEAGVALARRGVRATATLYRAAVRDALVPREEPTAPGRFYFVNAGRVRLQGLESDATLEATDWLRLTLAATLTDHRFVSFPTDSTPLDGNHVPGLPVVSGYGLVSAGPTDGPLVELEVVHAGRAWADDANTASAAPWTQWHLRASWQASRWTAFGGVRNLLDARAAGSLTVNGANRRYFEPAPGRSWYLGIETRIGG